MIIATGAEYRRPALANLSQFEGAGVYYAATPMEAQLCVGEEVIVVGGGNSAGQAAVFLAQTAKRVHMLVRGDGLADTMSRYLIRRIEDNPAIVLRTHAQIVALEGNGHLERVRWRDDRAGNVETNDIRHVFMMTGAVPNTGWLERCVALDDKGFIKTGPDLSQDDLASAGWPLSGRPIFSKRVDPASLRSAMCGAAMSSASPLRSARDRLPSHLFTRYSVNRQAGRRGGIVPAPISESESVTWGTPRARWVLLATVLGSGIAFLDATVVNVALPTIGTELDASVAGLQWIVNGYTLTLASLILIGGSLGDRFGRRRIFLLGVVWFAAASLLCGVAPTSEALVAARALQGIGGALLTPGSLAILQASFASGDRGRAVGAWSGLSGIAAAIGPFVGGWLIGAGSWRLIFLINVPLAVAVVAVALRHVPETRDPCSRGRHRRRRRGADCASGWPE